MDQSRELNVEEQKALLIVARETIVHHVERQEPPVHRAELDGMGFERGAFVTIQKGGQLRGCIGNFTSEAPLWQNVEEMAVAASSQDPRFPPVSPAELAELEVEISVLSPLTPIEDLEQIEVGVHGIYIISPRGRGVLLPQVAVEYNWDRWTFLDQTCRKAGLPGGCWRDPEVQVLVFTAQVFSEKDLGMV